MGVGDAYTVEFSLFILHDLAVLHAPFQILIPFTFSQQTIVLNHQKQRVLMSFLFSNLNTSKFNNVQQETHHQQHRLHRG